MAEVTSDRDMSRKDHAIVLSGGGANGAYGLGVMEALLGKHCTHCRDVEPTVFTGTSVGCFNAAVLASSDRTGPEAVRRLRELWLDRIAERDGRPNGVFRVRGDVRDYRQRAVFMDPPRDAWDFMLSMFARGVDLAFSNDTPGRRLLRFFEISDVISTEPMKRLISETIEPRWLQAGKKLRIVTCNWDTGEPVVFYNTLDPREENGHEVPSYKLEQLNENNTIDAILASTAIPALFPRVNIGGDYFVDGGVVMNTPLTPAIEAGAEVLHVIHLESKLERLPFGRSPSAFEAIERILAVTPVQLINADIRRAALRNELIRVAHQLERTLVDANALATSGDGPREDVDQLRQFAQKHADSVEIVVHRYYPSRQIGGAIGLLDFSQPRLADLIELGFRDAVAHDCQRNRCVL